MQNFQSRPPYQNYAYNRGQPSQPIQPSYYNQPSYPPSQQTNLADDRFSQLQQMIMTQSQSLTRLEAQIDQLTESTMRRELGQLPNEPILNFENDPPIHQSLGPSHQSKCPI